MSEELKSWVCLNKFLMSENNEAEVGRLFTLELHGNKRRSFLKRIYGRFSQLRKERETKEFGI